LNKNNPVFFGETVWWSETLMRLRIHEKALGCYIPFSEYKYSNPVARDKGVFLPMLFHKLWKQGFEHIRTGYSKNVKRVSSQPSYSRL